MKYLMFSILLLPACTSQSSPSARERQEEALRDPMNYKVDKPNSISGGGTADLNKEALKKDFNSVFNP
jgi:hypothetical protein